MVGIELTDDAVDLPEFKHPRMAAYVLGPERGNLSPEMQAKCAHIIKIPTNFCINVSLAGALVMYDRVRSMGGWRDRPIMPGGPKV
jgi:tRNA G18 (ribose-2'-O)-methylase SpoU